MLQQDRINNYGHVQNRQGENHAFDWGGDRG